VATGRHPAAFRRFLLSVALVAILTGCDRPRSLPTPCPVPKPAATGPALPTAPAMSPQPRHTPSPGASPLLSVWPSPSRSVTLPAPPGTPAPTNSAEATLRERIVARARYYAGTETRYRLGSTGPTFFDCTGLVYRVFKDCAALELIGAQGEQHVRSYCDWFLARKQADLQPPEPGDLIVYGADFAHIGIYVGDGRVISTLTAGVREHAVQLRDGLNGPIMPVQAYLHLEAE